jgi:aldehyde:ferredoxin oxidoreductase
MSTDFSFKRLIIHTDCQQSQTEAIDSGDICKVLGGRGLNSSYLSQKLRYGTDPLGQDNIFCIAAGLLTGRYLFGSCITFASGLSPISHTLGDAKITGKFGADMRDSGYFQIAITGASSQPLYIVITPEKVVFRDAGELWGLTSFAAVDRLKELYPRSSVLCIGPAGEKQIPFASVMSDDCRTFARCGLGAVLGSKQIKAVVLDASRSHPKNGFTDEYKNRCRQINRKIAAAVSNGRSPYLKRIRQGGSGGSLIKWYKAGKMPVNNWTRTTLKDAEELSAENFSKYSGKREGCLGCPMICFHNVSFAHDGIHVRGKGIHIEFLASMGLLLGITDLGWILRLCYIANELGLDIVESANAIAFVTECQEKNILPPEFRDSGLQWNTPRKAEALLHDIAEKRGIGKLLAMGTLKAAEKIHPDAADLVVATKGMAWNALETRAMKAAALFHFTSTRGGDCSKGMGRYFSRCSSNKMAGLADYVWEQENEIALTDSLGICKWILKEEKDCLNPIDIEELCSIFLNRDISYEALLEKGGDVVRSEHLMNIEMGLNLEPELPKKLFIPVSDGPNKGECIDPDEFREELEAYRRLRFLYSADQETPAN